MNNETKIVLLCGGFASGKTFLSKCLYDQGYTVVTTSEALENKATAGNEILDRSRLRELFQQNRSSDPNSDIIIQHIVNKTKITGNYAIDSIRYIYQLNFIVSAFRKVCTIYVDTPLQQRYLLNLKRRRYNKDICDFAEFENEVLDDKEEELTIIKERSNLNLPFFENRDDRQHLMVSYLGTYFDRSDIQ